MEILIAGAVVVAVGLLWYFNRDKSLDVNNDGKVDLADAKAAVANVATGVTAAADVNKDGKVDAKDAKVAVKKAKTTVKKAVKKVAPKKPATKKKPTPKQ